MLPPIFLCVSTCLAVFESDKVSEGVAPCYSLQRVWLLLSGEGDGCTNRVQIPPV